MLLESFKPACRLNIDSPKSPRVVKMDSSAPNAAATHHTTCGPPRLCHKIAKPTELSVPKTTPAQYPSQVFLGLKRGLRRCFPKRIPTKYAAMSASQIV